MIASGAGLAIHVLVGFAIWTAAIINVVTLVSRARPPD